MFTPVTKHLFWWPVQVRLPDPDPENAGKFAARTFHMQFAAMSLDRARELDEEAARLPEAERAREAFAFLREIAIGWRDVEDEQKVAVPFSPELYRAQLAYPWFRDAVLAAYGQATSGQEARLGN